MMETQRKMSSHRWWFESHSCPRRSPWLRSTLAELEEKTEAMLKLIEEDADSFAKRAEMYYKKRPELISMVEDFYRAHRSLAERYDLLKTDAGTRVLANLGFQFSFKKSNSEKSMSLLSHCSDISDADEPAESEIDDPPDPEDEIQVSNNKRMSHKLSSKDEEFGDSEVDDPEQEDEKHKPQVNKEVSKLREEIEKLRDENAIQKEQLMQKDEEKREVIRQLSLAVGVLKDENLKLRKFVAAAADAKGSTKKWGQFEFNKLKGGFLGKLFNGSGKSQPSIVAL